MAGTLEDLVNEIAEEEEMEKNASKNEVDVLAEEVMARTLEKIAKAKIKPKAEKDPEEMIEGTEDNEADDGDEESEEVEEEVRGKLSKAQKEKVASISGKFSSPEKKELFEKLASFQLLSNPRVVRDNNFQKYETLDRLPKEIQMFFEDQGEEVNNI